MQVLRDRHGVPTVLSALRYLGIRLRAAPDTASLAAPVDAARAALAAADEAWLAARERSVELTQELAWLDNQLTDAVAALGRDALVLVDGERADPRFRRLFPLAPSRITGRSDDDRRSFVRAAVEVLRLDPTLAPLGRHAGRLEAALAAVEANRDRRDQARVPELRTGVDRAAALTAARLTYNQLEPMLTLLLPGDPGRVAAYFMDLTSAATPEAAEVTSA